MSKNQDERRLDRGWFPPHRGLVPAAGFVRIHAPNAACKLIRVILAPFQDRLERKGIRRHVRGPGGRPRGQFDFALLAPEVGLSAYVLRRLVSGVARSVSYQTYNRLLELAGSRRDILRNHLLGEGVLDVIAGYERALDREMRSGETQVLGLSARDRRRLRALRRGSKRLDRAVVDLDRTIRAFGHTRRRQLVAYSAALRDLNRHVTTFGVELGLHELRARDLAGFVAMGLRREILLLRREADLTRAQKRASPGVRVRDRASGELEAWDFTRAVTPRHVPQFAREQH